MRETWVQSPGREDPLKRENGNPFEYSCREIPWTDEPGGLQSMGSQKNGTQLSSAQHKLDWEKAEEPEIKLPTSVGSSKKLENYRKNICFCFIDYRKGFDYIYHNKLWKILQEMGIPDHLTYLLWNLYADQEATFRTGHGTTDWFQIGKGLWQSCILSPWLFNLYSEYIMWNARLDEAQLESSLLGETSITSDMQMTPP